MEPIPPGRLAELAGTVVGRESLLDRPVPAAFVDLDDDAPAPAVPASLPLVLVGVGATAAPSVEAVDVVVPDEDAATDLLAAVARAPLAAVSLVVLLRGAGARSVPEGLVAESSTYSTLQAGPEHHAWLERTDRPAHRDGPDGPVAVERDGDVLRITLDRPHVRNAVDARLREALLDALALAQSDSTLAVELRGNGPSFCSGGDLSEFGTLADPASAHLLRMGRSPALALWELAARTTAYVHGAAAGAGVELAAFAGRVVARRDARFSLPELGLGLVPGAGGTVSLTRRIGRHRTAWLALTGEVVDAETALAWGLVEELD